MVTQRGQGKPAKRVYDEHIVKFRCPLWNGSFLQVEQRSVLIDLSETVFVPGDGHERKFRTFTELHTREDIEPGLFPQPDEIQRAGAVVDIGQYSRIITIGEHTGQQLLRAERPVAQAKIAVQVQ